MSGGVLGARRPNVGTCVRCRTVLARAVTHCASRTCPWCRLCVQSRVKP